jgi:TPR repeat protein
MKNRVLLFVWIMRVSPSQTVHSLFSAAELVLAKQWLEIRDIFFGQNRARQDITRALELAAACEHKEGQWLTRVFVSKTVSTEEEARFVFLALGENDARGLCFAALLDDSDEGDDSDEENESFALLRRSAELGYAFAQVKMAEETRGEERFRFATLAALQWERDGFDVLGFGLQYGHGCDGNKNKALENFLVAAELGHVHAMACFGKC